MEQLQSHLQKHPGIRRIYFSETGNWQFHPRGTYPTVKTREEVLAMQADVQHAPAASAQTEAGEKKQGF